jgi:thiol-disulfide isomerase/thioredoxin
LFGQKITRNSIKKIPELSIHDIKGDTLNLRHSSANKVTFINFWFIPCGPCFAEMNMLHKLYAKYKDNPKVLFLTISVTDSSSVRPLIENRNTPTNETYEYFRTLAKLDTFRLPVYFVKGVGSKVTSFKKAKIGFSGDIGSRKKDEDYMLHPANVFGFSSYPTTFIFDKNGNVIYKKTGFTKEEEKHQKKAIETIISANL